MTRKQLLEVALSEEKNVTTVVSNTAKADSVVDGVEKLGNGDLL